MKKNIFFTFTICSLFFGICNAQWQPDVRLTNNPGESLTCQSYAWCVASSGVVVHVVWRDDRDGNDEIYYKRSTDGGTSWGTDTRLTNQSAASSEPNVAVSGLVVHVVWYDLRDGTREVYYKRSTDGGISWGVDTQLTNLSTHIYFTSVSVSGSVVHVVWQDTRLGVLQDEIYYIRSTDGGISWGAETRLTNNAGVSAQPSVSVSGSVVHVVWYDARDGNNEIYYKRSTDGGISWGTDTRLTNNSANSGIPSVSVSGSVVHVVWDDDRNGSTNHEVYYKRSTDGGVSWGADTRLTNNSGNSFFPSVSVSGQAVHIVWKDNRDGNYEIYYKRSPDGGTSWSADTRLTNNSAISSNASVSVSGSVVHVVWYDERDGNREIYFKRDTTGNVVGITNINSEIPNSFSLSQNYPNPFNPSTKIQFALLKNSIAMLVVYDALGRQLETLVSEQLNAGTYEADWNAAEYSSGIYFYKLSADGFTETKKMLMVK